MQIPNDRFSKLRDIVEHPPQHGDELTSVVRRIVATLPEILDIADKLYIIIEEIDKERRHE